MRASAPTPGEEQRLSGLVCLPLLLSGYFFFLLLFNVEQVVDENGSAPMYCPALKFEAGQGI